MQESVESERVIDKQNQESNITENGIEVTLDADNDVVMNDAEISDGMTIDM